jgi:hypothetical protein
MLRWRLGCWRVRVIVTEDSFQVRLALWQKLLGLMRDIDLSREDIEEASVVEDPVREAMGSGIKVGLRVPWLYYVARTIRLDEAFVVRRGVPGLSLRVRNHRQLVRVLVSTPHAEELAERLRGS